MPAAPSSIPRYAQIAQVLKSRLEARETAETGPFATEHALCEEFGVSRTTVRQALGFLKREGLITSRPGVGTNGTATEIFNRVVRSSGDPLHGMLKSKPRIVSPMFMRATACIIRAVRRRDTKRHDAAGTQSRRPARHALLPAY